MIKAAIKYLRDCAPHVMICFSALMLAAVMRVDSALWQFFWILVFNFTVAYALEAAAAKARAEAQTEAARLLLNSLLSGQDTNINVAVETREVKP